MVDFIDFCSILSIMLPLDERYKQAKTLVGTDLKLFLLNTDDIEVLDKFYHEQEQADLYFIARNKNLPAKRVESLTNYKAVPIRALAYANPNLPRKVIEKTLKTIENVKAGIRFQLASNPSLTADEIVNLYNAYTDPIIRDGILNNPNSPELLLMELLSIRLAAQVQLNSISEYNICNALSGPVLSAENIDNIFKNFLSVDNPNLVSKTNMLEALARNPRTPSRILKAFVEPHINQQLVVAAAFNPNTPISGIATLLLDVPTREQLYATDKDYFEKRLQAALIENYEFSEEDAKTLPLSYTLELLNEEPTSEDK